MALAVALGLVGKLCVNGAHLHHDRHAHRRVRSNPREAYRQITPSALKLASRQPADEELFARFAKLARSTDGPIPAWFETWLEAEREAHMLRIWQPLIIPGLLQTAEYARALFVAAGADEERAEDMVKARLDRQAILERPEPPNLVTVLDESVLHRLIGSPQVMADQLSYLAERATLPHVLVQVVPAGNGANAGLSGGFALASCDGAPDTLRMEAIEDVTAEGRSLVRMAANIFVRVQADALPRAASRTLILEAAEQWKTN
jgi:hypothetical protein